MVCGLLMKDKPYLLSCIVCSILTLKNLCTSTYNEHIQICLDGTTALKYLSKIGDVYRN